MIDAVLPHFHFLRPDWFWALVPAVLLFLILRTRYARQSNWEQSIDRDLLPYLLDAPKSGSSKRPLVLMLIAWLLATVALAGPVWHKLPQPVHERQNALVVIMDLTRSMYAVDVDPNRLTRERQKLTDLLNERKEGVTGLVVFAGDAHAVTPLTDDPKNIEAMIPALAPEIMPAPGSRLAPALQRAYQLFKDGGAATGRILVMTDEIRDLARAEAVARAHREDYPVSVLAVGTAQGAPISADHLTPNGGYLRDKNGNLIIPKVNFANLEAFARQAGGRFSPMTVTDADLRYLLADKPMPGRDKFTTLHRDFDVWREEGPWLLLLLLPIAAFAFRRGWLWSLLPLMLMLHSRPAEASIWEDLWKTPDQQGSAALKHGNAARAAQLFENKAWRATARYRNKDFADAAKTFASIDSSNGKYNLGNALAHQGHYEDAIKAYDKALAMNPHNADAAYNKKLLEKLLKQKKEQNKQGKQGKNKQQQHGKSGKGQQAQNNQKEQQQSGKSQSQQGDRQQQQNQQARAGDKKKQQSQSAAQRQAERQKEKAQREKEREAERGKKGKHGKQNKQQAAGDANHLTDEQRQAIQQWLRRVPDDPGGLLRRKFALQHQEEIEKGEIQPDETQNW